MMTTLFDLLSTASAIGLVSSLAALGIAALPWRSSEADRASSALDAVVRLPAVLMAPTPVPQPELARR